MSEQAVLCLDRHLAASFTMYTLCLEYMGPEHGIGLDAAYQVHAYAWTVSIDAYEIGIGSVFHEKAGLAPAAGGPSAGRYKAVRQISLLWFLPIPAVLRICMHD